jgi:hypothetical protein
MRSGPIPRGAALTVLLAVSYLARAESWVTRYPRARASEAAVCGAHQLARCQQALLELERLLDSRLDVEYKLARVEAELGLAESALRRLDLYARSGLELGDPGELPVFARLKENARFKSMVEVYRAGLVAKTDHVRVANLGTRNSSQKTLCVSRRTGHFWSAVFASARLCG